MTVRTPRSDSFDTIVVGSGIGGLVSAAALARLRGQRVLVLEQHGTIGGFTHEFKRPGGYRWDVGVHYLGGMGPGDQGSRILDRLGDGSLAFSRMPEPFERYVYPGLDFRQPGDPDQFRASLTAAFPRETRGIRRYLDAVHGAARWVAVHGVREVLPPLIRGGARMAFPRGGRVARRTTAEVLSGCVEDPLLRAVLASQWGDYGLRPGESAFGIHALIVDHYLRGGWYPVGGGGAIARSLRPTIEGTGGEVRAHARVRRILVEHGRAVGVVMDSGDVLRAPFVISDAGAANTYGHLLGDAAPAHARTALARFPPPYTVVAVFLGLSGDPATLGVNGGNVWVFEGTDHDDPAKLASYVSFPSMKDPLATAHTAEIISPVDANAFREWAGRPWPRRDAAYLDAKNAIADRAMGLAETAIPGLRALTAMREVATPLTFAHFDGTATGGSTAFRAFLFGSGMDSRARAQQSPGWPSAAPMHSVPVSWAP